MSRKAVGIPLFRPLERWVSHRAIETVNTVSAVLMTAWLAIRFCVGFMPAVACFRAIGFREPDDLREDLSQ